MNFSMFSCSHFSKFLSDPIKKQSVMSKRVQESTLKEWSAVAKPKPTKLKLTSNKKVPSQEVIDPNSLRNQSLDSMVSQLATGNRLRRPPTKAQLWILKRGNKAMLRPQTSGNSGRRDESSNSARSWKQSAREAPRITKYSNGTKLHREFEDLLEFVRHHPEVGIFQSRRDSEHDWMYEVLQIPSFAWGKCEISQKQIEDEKVKWTNVNKPILAERIIWSWWRTDWVRKVCKNKTLNLRILEIESSSCQCSTTSNGQRKETQMNVFQIPNKSKITRRDSHEASVLETKRNGMTSQLYSWRRMRFHGHTRVERLKETNHPVLKSTSVLSCGILKRKKNRDTIHFTADASSTELLYRTIHSANQFRISGAVACWCEEFGLKPDETSEMLTRTENEQILKEVTPQESKCFDANFKVP